MSSDKGTTTTHMLETGTVEIHMVQGLPANY